MTERKNKTLVEIVNIMLTNSNLNNSFWDYIIIFKIIIEFILKVMNYFENGEFMKLMLMGYKIWAQMHKSFMGLEALIPLIDLKGRGLNHPCQYSNFNCFY